MSGRKEKRLVSKKIVLAGGTGFIGQYLAQQFRDAGYEVLIISRQAPNILWEQQDRIVEALEGAELLINLAGKSVDCRYNAKNKATILNSRVETTEALGEAILACKSPPRLWINSSTATIYRHAEDRPMTESEGELGTGFSVNVAKAWEKTFFGFELPQIRQVALRMAIVLGKGGGVTQPLVNLVRFGLGGKQGNGKQRFSWIHIEDLHQIILFLQAHSRLTGVFNCSAPNPVTNEQLMQALRKSLNVPLGLSTPAWLLEFGAVFIRTETELVLKSRWVMPERLLEEGYTFRYANLEEALQNILHHE